MPGLGTLINVAAIVVGGLLGLLLRSRLSDELQQNLVRVVALCTLFIGIQGTLEQAIVLSEGAVKMQGTMMAMG